MKEKQRIEAIQAVMDGRLKVEEGGTVLGRSVRQIWRMLRRLREKGLEGLVHGNRGRVSPRKISPLVREKIVMLVQGKYKDINDTHLREILERQEKILLGRETLRSILRAAGIAPKCKRRRPKYRRRRERKEAFGMMLQIDASDHDWLEGRGRWLTLVGAKDDATGYVWARFVPAETTWAYLNLMGEIFGSHGLPLSLYSDRHSIFHILREPTIFEQLKNIKPLTQFGRAMEETGITIIPAYSPQAKGRIENQWRTLQDRLVVEIRLAGASTLEQANLILDQCLKDYNLRFTVTAKNRDPVFRKSPCSSKLDRILCLKETRTVNKDHTISFEGLILQIPPSKKFRSIARQKVEVLQLKDGGVQIVYKQLTVARFSPETITRLVSQNKSERSQLKIAA
jgi:transposase